MSHGVNQSAFFFSLPRLSTKVGFRRDCPPVRNLLLQSDTAVQGNWLPAESVSLHLLPVERFSKYGRQSRLEAKIGGLIYTLF